MYDLTKQRHDEYPHGEADSQQAFEGTKGVRPGSRLAAPWIEKQTFSNLTASTIQSITSIPF
jgi:hypothetical protein